MKQNYFLIIALIILLAIFVRYYTSKEILKETINPTETIKPTIQPTIPTGKQLTKTELLQLATEFTDQVFIGGQISPRSPKWVNNNVFIFLQFDNPDNIISLRYIGIGVRGVFCAEKQPDKAFTHFHKFDAREYPEGHGTQAGEQGYWVMWVAVDNFESQGRSVKPGIDYNFVPTPPPQCGSDIARTTFLPQYAGDLTKDEIGRLVALFNDNPLTGSQIAPRVSRWVNNDTFIFLQFDNPDLTQATSLRYIGIGVRGEFCKEKQPHTDFTHLHKYDANTYAEGHAEQAGDKGYWLLWVAADEFDVQGRRVNPGADREFALLTPPACIES